MRSVMVRYTVKPAEAQRNEELVRAVYDELHRRQPDAMSYATFKLDDGVSFVHVHVSANDDGSSALARLPAFQEFQRGAAERCQDGPVVTQLHAVGSYGFLAGGDRDKL
jgi:hypothetical protein